MRLGVDVGGTNTDAVLMDGTEVVAWAKRPTSSSVSRGVAATINAVLEKAGIEGREVSCVMIGTTQFANALVQGLAGGRRNPARQPFRRGLATHDGLAGGHLPLHG
jgi:N-methylhydantoinase A/oxoprolinase/acetone carboxylase beta subunit